VTASISLIIGSVAVHKTDHLNHYLDSHHEAVFGKGKIWKDSNWYFKLYFAKKPLDKNDELWDGNYSKGYFDW